MLITGVEIAERHFSAVTTPPEPLARGILRRLPGDVDTPFLPLPAAVGAPTHERGVHLAFVSLGRYVERNHSVLRNPFGVHPERPKRSSPTPGASG